MSSSTSSGYNMSESVYNGFQGVSDNTSLRKVSNSSTERDSCFGSYTDEYRNTGEIIKY